MSYFDTMDFIASDAAIRPATEGTNATLAGGVLPLSHLVIGLGSSVENTTLRCAIPLFFSSLRITRARGQTVVFVISVTVSAPSLITSECSRLT